MNYYYILMERRKDWEPVERLLGVFEADALIKYVNNVAFVDKSFVVYRTVFNESLVCVEDNESCSSSPTCAFTVKALGRNHVLFELDEDICATSDMRVGTDLLLKIISH